MEKVKDGVPGSSSSSDADWSDGAVTITVGTTMAGNFLDFDLLALGRDFLPALACFRQPALSSPETEL